ncbi:MAG: hypothetical protein VCA36_03000 [Opitutales bacterium]
MKSQVFRIIAWGLAVGVTALWFLQGGAVAERRNELQELEAKLEKAERNKAAVEAASKEEKARLVQECSKLEDEDGVVTDEMNGIRSQVNAVDRAISDENATLAVMQQETVQLPDRLLQLRAELGQAQGQLNPLQQEEATLKADRATLENELAAHRATNDEQQAKLAALREERASIQSQYDQKSGKLRLKIQEPPWIYYGDKTTTKPSNVRPSMTGLFLPLGYGDGLKIGMEFLVRRLDPTLENKRSWRFKMKLVQADHCFAVIMPEFGDQDIPMRAGEELEMERSGDLASEAKGEEAEKKTPLGSP